MDAGPPTPAPQPHPTADLGPQGGVAAPLPGGERAGDALGPYRLLSVIGEGGFGVVWLAERREPFVQRVAIKVIKAGMDSKAVIARFEQERQALALMDHPGIAKVIDGGVTPPAMGSRPYFVMQHIAGEPITTYCDRLKLPIRARLELFAQVCEAVQHSHMRGVIHRDLKPSNILVCADESSGGKGGGARPVVIDFGVAKALAHTLTARTLFTDRGVLIGTPEYMSPEQAEMSGTDVDTRADVYSLGVVLYELLTGSVPFDAETLRNAGYAAVQRIIREEEPPRPSTKVTKVEGGTTVALARAIGARELAAQLRRELEWIPLKAIRKSRDERYKSADRLAEDVQNYLAGRPLVAGPPTLVYRARKWVGRHRGAAVASGVVLVVAGVLGSLLARQYGRTMDATREARVQAYEANIAASAGLLERNQVSEARRRLSLCPEELRGWEWRHLWWWSDASDARRDMNAPVTALRIAPDGASVAVAVDGDVVVLSADLKKELRRWAWRKGSATEAHARQVCGHGRVVLAERDDGAWVVASEGKPASVVGLVSPVLGADGEHVVGWRARAADARKTLVSKRVGGAGEELAVAADAFALSVDGRWLLAIRSDSVEVIDMGAGHRGVTRLAAGAKLAETGYLGAMVVEFEGPVARLALLASGLAIDLAEGSVARRARGEAMGGKLLATTSGAGLRLERSESGGVWLTPFEWDETSCEVETSGRFVVTADSTGLVRVWPTAHVSGMQWPRGAEVGSNGVVDVLASPPYQRLLLASFGGRTTENPYVLDVAARRTVRGLGIKATEPHGYAAGPTAVTNGAVSAVWNGAGEDRERWVTPPLTTERQGQPMGVVAGTRPLVITSGIDPKLIRLDDDGPKVVWTAPTSGRSDSCWCEGGRGALCIAVDRALYIWSGATSGETVGPPRPAHLPENAAFPAVVAFDQAAARLAVATSDGRLWLSGLLAESPVRFAVCEGTAAATIEGVVFSPDGTRVFTRRRDRSLQVWDTASRRLELTLPLPGRPVSIQFPDAKEDATVLLEHGEVLDLLAPPAAAGQ